MTLCRFVRLCCWFLGPLLVACAGDLPKESLLVDLRVLAIVADPIDVGPGDEVVAERFLYVPDDVVIESESWSFCPLNAGASLGYACLLPQCETTMTPTAAMSHQVRFNPTNLVMACFVTLAEQGGSEPGAPQSSIDKRDFVPVTLHYEVHATSGLIRRAVKTLNYYFDAAPEPRNQSPVLNTMSFATQTLTFDAIVDLVYSKEFELLVEIDPNTLDTYVSAAGESIDEEPISWYFASTGSFEAEKLSGLIQENVWTPPEEPWENPVEFYVVTRDIRGGQSVAGPFLVNIQAPLL